MQILVSRQRFIYSVCRRALRAVVLLGAMAFVCAGQNTGTIHGRVSDPSGLGVPAAAVTATHEARGTTRTVSSGPQGEYVLPLLPPGIYDVKVEVSGFKSFVQRGIELSPNANLRVDAKLDIGSVSESVSVTAEAPLVDSRSSVVGTLIDARRVLELPMDGRNVVGLAVLLPGVTSITAPQTFVGDRSGPTVTVSGSRGNANLFIFDGANYNGFYRNTGLNLPPPDALQEVKVLTNTFSAEYGRNSGAIFNAVTKSGTNEIHGALWEFHRNQKLNARNFFASGEKPKLIQNQFGFAAGGPLRKDKLFIFGSYEGLRVRPGALGASAFPLTEAERAGDFRGSAAVRDPLTGQPFPDNLIPANRIDTVARNLLAKPELMPLPNRPNGQYVFTFPTPQRNDTYLVRSDYNLGKHTIDGRYNFIAAKQRDYGGQVPTYLTHDYDTPTHSVTVGDTFVLRPNLLNTVRVSFSRFVAGRLNANPFHISDLGANFPLITRSQPSLAISGRVNLGSSSGSNEINQNQSWQISESVNWTKDRHTIKAGVEVFRWTYFYEADALTMGDFTFTGAVSGVAAADFVLGRPAALRVASPAISSGVRSFNTYSYVQDDWRIHPRLTLNLGLRYELTLPGVYPNGDMVPTFRAGQQSQKLPNAPPGMVFQGDPGVTVFPLDRNNFAPRVGLVWDPTGRGRTSIRAAYGLFYDIRNADAFDSANAQPFRYQFTFNVPASLTDPLRGQPTLPLTVDRSNPFFIKPVSVYFNDPTTRSPYVHQYNLNVQHEAAKGLLLQVGYVGRLGFKLPLTIVSNPAIYRPGATLANIDDRRIYPGYGANNTVTTQANSAYHGLQVEVTKRYSRDFSLQGAYTYGRAIDMYSSISIGANAPNVFNLRSQRGLSDGHAQQVASFSWIWDLPRLTSAHPVVRHAVGGWQFNGLFTARSGRPFDLAIGADVALTGVAASVQRPDVIGEHRLSSDRSKGEKILAWFDRNAFARPANGTYGNVGRNALIGPGQTATNFGLFKNIALPGREGLRLQFRSEFFNALNNTSLGNPRSSLADGARMGLITSAGSARVVQLALKLLF